MLDTPVAEECLAQYCLAPEFNMIDTQVRPAPLPALRQRAQVRHRPHQVETAPVDEEASSAIERSRICGAGGGGSHAGNGGSTGHSRFSVRRFQ